MVTVCQAVTDAAQIGKSKPCWAWLANSSRQASRLRSLRWQARDAWWCKARRLSAFMRRKVKAVDASGAGATFSSGFIYGYLNGWSLEETVRFAIAAASLKVTRSGLAMFPVQAIQGLARHRPHGAHGLSRRPLPHHKFLRSKNDKTASQQCACAGSQNLRKRYSEKERTKKSSMVE
jgi:hypothetical protein